MESVICLGQQPNGIFPKRFFVAKVLTALKLREKIGGHIVWFCHDSDHDYRETITRIRSPFHKEGFATLNFRFKNKIQRKFTPLYLKEIGDSGWKERTERILERITPKEAVDAFVSTDERFVADFCIEIYRRLRLLDRIEIVRSSSEDFRRKAVLPKEFYADIEYGGEIVRAKKEGDYFVLHEGGKSYIRIPAFEVPKTKVSATGSERFAWMKSVVRCTHYVMGRSEEKYLDLSAFPDVKFIRRMDISDENFAFTKEFDPKEFEVSEGL